MFLLIGIILNEIILIGINILSNLIVLVQSKNKTKGLGDLSDVGFIQK
jgi:hypothetical protein